MVTPRVEEPEEEGRERDRASSISAHSSVSFVSSGRKRVVDDGETSGADRQRSVPQIMHGAVRVTGRRAAIRGHRVTKEECWWGPGRGNLTCGG